jgi:DNA-binding CsgD family transcriptional regulator
MNTTLSLHCVTVILDVITGIRFGGIAAMGAIISGRGSGVVHEVRMKLTPRQVECLEWVQRGFETKEIARELGLSPETVDMHIKNATQRLGVSTRRAAARLVHGDFVLPQSLVPPPSGISAARFSGDTEAAALVGPEPQTLLDVVGWPLPTAAARTNNLTGAQRLFWVGSIAVGALLGFGALVSSLEALGRILHL